MELWKFGILMAERMLIDIIRLLNNFDTEATAFPVYILVSMMSVLTLNHTKGI